MAKQHHEQWGKGADRSNSKREWSPRPPGIPRSLQKDLAAVFLEIGRERAMREALAAFRVEGFAPIREDAFEKERQALKACEGLLKETQ